MICVEDDEQLFQVNLCLLSHGISLELTRVISELVQSQQTINITSYIIIMSTRLPLATSGVENVHVHQSGKGDATTKLKEKPAGEGGSRLEREVNLTLLLRFLTSADSQRSRLLKPE
jgi:hypothetical protein